MKNARELNGYRVLYKPEHPTSMVSENWKGWIYEHIFLGEQIIGRPLRKNEVVHHLDGDRANNRIENLLVLEKSQHTKLHEWLDRGAPFTEKEGVDRVNSVESKANEFCKVCNSTLQRKQSMYCSVTCRAKDAQRTERPTKEQLERLLEDHSYLALGRMFSVSDNAVRKWAKKYDLL
jgi:hypothetical protein